MPRTQPTADWPVDFRAAGPRDAGQITDFISGLSPRTQYLRFFTSVASPSSGLVRGLCGASGADVVLAFAGGRVIGHGMAADRTGSDGVRVSEIGLVVADRWQQRGVGTAMLRIVVARAAARGTRMLVMDVLPGNHRILGVIGRRWPGASRELTTDSIVIRVRLTAADLRAADAVPGHRGQVRHQDQGQRGADRRRDERPCDGASHPAA